MNFDLKSSLSLLIVAGSRAYGINQSDSDLDIKGICIPPKDFYAGFINKFEQADDIKSLYPMLPPAIQDTADRFGYEGTVFEWRKFIKLAADSNPNILEIIWSPDKNVIFSNYWGELLRENREAFLSSRARWTFSGYAVAQMKRIETSRKWLLDPPLAPPERSQFGLLETPQLPKDQLGAINSMIQKEIDRWEIDFGDALKSSVESAQTKISNFLSDVFVIKEIRDLKFEIAARKLSVDDNLLEYLTKERAYRIAQDNWEKYSEWKKKRNKSRAILEEKFGYDCKHAAHLWRLLQMAEEILLGMGVRVDRTGIDADEILRIRAGAWKFDDILQFSKEKDENLAKLYETTGLKKQPDSKMIEKICISGVESVFLKEAK